MLSNPLMDLRQSHVFMRNPKPQSGEPVSKKETHTRMLEPA